MTSHTELTAELIDRFEAVLSDLGPATRAMGRLVCAKAKANVSAGGAVCVGEIIEIPDDLGTRIADWNDERYKLPAGAKLYAYATPSTAQESLAKAIHYPDCWDDTAYPTVADALAVVYMSFKCSNEDNHSAPAERVHARDCAVYHGQECSCGLDESAIPECERAPSTAQAALPEPIGYVWQLEDGSHVVMWAPLDDSTFYSEPMKYKRFEYIYDKDALRAHCLALKREPVLTGDLKVGAGLFRKGVSISTVQGAIDRQINDYLVRPMTYFSTDGCEKHHGQGWSGLIPSGPVMMPTKVCPLCKEDAHCLALRKGGS